MWARGVVLVETAIETAGKHTPATFCLKKWRLLHFLSQKVASPPPFVSKSGVSSTFCLKK